MHFPKYVPAAVREYLLHYLEGGEHSGYLTFLKNAEQELLDAKNAMNAYMSKWEEFGLEGDGYFDRLRLQYIEAKKRRDRLADDVSCLQRLAINSDMKKVFEILTAEISDDRIFRHFIHSAWTARVNFTEHRESLRRAKELVGAIACQADSLAGLLSKLSETWPDLPLEFVYPRELLRKTESRTMNGHNLEMWQTMRGFVLGDLTDGEQSMKECDGLKGVPTGEASIISESGTVEASPDEKIRGRLQYAWGTAPCLYELLDTLANTARNFEPNPAGFVGAAIGSRQKNQRTEYLRAFADQLADESSLKITAGIMNAIAKVANVAINDMNNNVSIADVRGVFKRKGAK